MNRQLQRIAAESSQENDRHFLHFCYYEPKLGGKNMTFGEKLYQLRKAQEFLQEALAEKLHTSRQAISKWEETKGFYVSRETANGFLLYYKKNLFQN